MKLRGFAVALLVATAGCATQATAPVAPRPSPVATTRTSAAELGEGDADEAPKVSKPQHSVSGLDREGDDPKEGRHGERLSGGFSGYK